MDDLTRLFYQCGLCFVLCCGCGRFNLLGRFLILGCLQLRGRLFGNLCQGAIGGDELLDRDSVFGVKDSLIKDFVEQPAGTRTPDGRDLGENTWSRVQFDIVLAPDQATTGS